MIDSISQIHEAIIAININQTYHNRISIGALYDCTQGIWRLSKTRAENAKYAFAVYKGIVREVYEIDRWHSEGTTEYTERETPVSQAQNRYEFVGKIAPDSVRDKYIVRQMAEPHKQNPVRYYNC